MVLTVLEPLVVGVDLLVSNIGGGNPASKELAFVPRALAPVGTGAAAARVLVSITDEISNGLAFATPELVLVCVVSITFDSEMNVGVALDMGMVVISRPMITFAGCLCRCCQQYTSKKEVEVRETYTSNLNLHIQRRRCHSLNFAHSSRPNLR